jgi:hypothetical protein
MSKENSPKTRKLDEFAYQRGYVQALDDYSIASVLFLIHETDPTLSWAEAEMIAALLIEQLRKLITPELVSNYINVIRHSNTVDPFLQYPHYQDLLKGILLKSFT